MAKITVTTDTTTQRRAVVLLDESVHSSDLSHEDHAEQLIQRLGWAITEAENVEPARDAL